MTPAAVLPGSLERWYHLLSQEPCLSRFMVLIGFAENAPEIRSGSPFEVSLRRLHVRMLVPVLKKHTSGKVCSRWQQPD
jgi:hypothetical protein